jgi:class 3 adenylate cyclase
VEPQIRYCTTSDSVNIAYSVAGTGPALIWAPDLPLSHASLEWRASSWGPYLEPLAAEFTLIRFDARGIGLSDRNVTDFSMQAGLRDLEAVVAHGVEEPFALMGTEFTGPLAIRYATKHPGTVSHLILHDTFAKAADFTEHPVNKVSMDLLDRDWEMFIESRVSLSRGKNDDGIRTGIWTEFYRACVTEETDRLWRRQVAQDDVTGELPAISAPTLILCHTGTRTRSTEMSRKLAGIIRGSQLALLDGGVTGEWPRAVSLVAKFVKGIEATGQPSGAMAVILFTDIVSSTALTERLGDTRFREASRALDAGLRSAIRQSGGAAVDGKLLGDGVLATFPSAAQALDGARRCLALSAASEMGLHIGLHAGDVIREDNNVYGGAVNIASRICGLSEPGEILVSDVVRGMARSSADVEFEDRGEQEMKGVGEPVRVYAVREQP